MLGMKQHRGELQRRLGRGLQDKDQSSVAL